MFYILLTDPQRNLFVSTRDGNIKALKQHSGFSLRSSLNVTQLKVLRRVVDTLVMGKLQELCTLR